MPLHPLSTLSNQTTTVNETTLALSPLTLTPNIYQCQYPNCSKNYKKPCLLIEHQRTHTGEDNPDLAHDIR
ncbi:hypothetical protein HMI55_001720 [Coelomomyces lativittatus]|nr:hypothetical protein HMI55_001720 [Coelomomyces lativittatus]